MLGGRALLDANSQAFFVKFSFKLSPKCCELCTHSSRVVQFSGCPYARSVPLHLAPDDLLFSMIQISKKAPGPKGLPIVGNVIEAQRDFLGFCQRLAKDYGDVAAFRLAHLPSVLISHPELIQEVLQNKNGYYGKNPYHDAMGMILGDGLLTSEDEVWTSQRKIIQPIFQRHNIMEMTQSMSQISAERVAVWDKFAQENATIDMHEEMADLTLDIILTTMFGSMLTKEENRQIAIAMKDISEFAMQKPNQPIDIPTWVPIPQNFKLKRARRILDEVILKLIKHREASDDVHHDLLSMLMNARSEEGEGLSSERIRDQMATFIFAGHETTATHLSWTWMLLAQHPNVLEKLQEELRSVLDGRTPTVQDLPNLNYTRMVLEESLRVYPVIWTYGRRVRQDHDLGGYAMAEKSLIFISIHTMHHHPTYWENPDQFDPERFTDPKLKSGIYKHIYFPFGVGPRICIGNHFAVTESMITLATLAQKFSPTLIPNQKIVPEPLITLRPKYGIQMKLSKAKP